MDTIELRGLTFSGCHGVYETEKTKPQPFAVDLWLSLDLRPAGSRDELGLTVNYAEVIERVREVVEQTSRSLIEALAEDIASRILTGYPLVSRIRVTVRKLKPPLAAVFDSIGVTVERVRFVEAYLGLGTNLGDRDANLRRARTLLAALPDCKAWRFSSVRETEPWGNTEQPWFLNQAAAVLTALSPHELLEACLSIEQVLGRIRGEKWGPRLIDIDILLYSDRIIEEPDLVIPHPYLEQREFVLEPLRELNPELILPRRL
ncbi:MAG: 2-amino-4-hydroxy-6-hydroxymethyldihydropteridine diphosphokinase [Solirubrobacterales bacterium]